MITQTAVGGATAMALSSCAPTTPQPYVDLNPIGGGLEFLGLAFVLGVLIICFAYFIGSQK